MPLFAGVVGGAAEWVFRKAGVISVTVSAADAIVDEPAEELRDLLWRDVAAAYRPARRARSAGAHRQGAARDVSRHSGAAEAPPADARPAGANLLLAGDYVDTGLPATIEGAIRSGLAAAGRDDFGRLSAAGAPARSGSHNHESDSSAQR